jgi:murein DD-endopeptidase MepM/ murein hydrolase activator NlpD
VKRRSRLAPTVGAALALCLVATTAIPILAVTGGGTAPPTSAWAGIPPRALRAYQATDDWCTGLRWELVAAIGQVESGHGTSGGAGLDPESGEATPWIFGPPLDGSPGVQALRIGQWVGWWGLTGPWQQAVGPMQFLAPTFDTWGVDADEDRSASPHDIDDAAASAANYLCQGTDGEITDERAVVLRYNNSEQYAHKVLAIADSFADALLLVGDGWLCPIAGPVSFIDSWGAPRSGGRTHKGVDMFAKRGTPVVAPVSGTVEHRSNRIGGLSFHLWGDEGTYYYGTHLDAYGPITGSVGAGTVVGYVGDTGNARGTSPHLHFEIHPGRERGDPPAPVNPTPAVDAACAPNRIGAGIGGGD